MFQFEYAESSSPPAKCFCQLAGNPGCEGKPCDCPQGCTGESWRHELSVTFVNRVHASGPGCRSATALLTIPKSYMKDVGYLKLWCPAGTAPLLAEMLREGFRSYQDHVSPGPVRQCIHSGASVSVPWMHVHTICQGGVVDRMYGTGPASWCEDMFNVEQAETLAARIINWADGLPSEELAVQPIDPPSSCAIIGCGRPNPEGECSCSTAVCKEHGDCCEDALSVCPLPTTTTEWPPPPKRVTNVPRIPILLNFAKVKATGGSCRVMGCGHRGRHGSCACNDRCSEFKDCCSDYHAECDGEVDVEEQPEVEEGEDEEELGDEEEEELVATTTRKARKHASRSKRRASPPKKENHKDTIARSDLELALHLAKEAVREDTTTAKKAVHEDTSHNVTRHKDPGDQGKAEHSEVKPLRLRQALQSGGCWQLGCGSHGEFGQCSCHKDCKDRHNCCSDFESACGVETARFQ